MARVGKPIPHKITGRYVAHYRLLNETTESLAVRRMADGKQRTRRNADQTRIMLYICVSTDEQADSGLGLRAQEQALRTDGERRSWEVVAMFTDAGGAGKSLPIVRGSRIRFDCWKAGKRAA
jgi:hypothetical protein